MIISLGRVKAPERRVWFETYEAGEWARISQARGENGEWVNSVMLHAVPADCGTD
ncbi:hypothetical protein V0U79_07095 [Hyphobacterium sp. HN65]|uniref:Uncharacterized protein n=1 Tax=Hyphobacterium lacteum TaxID=3116575 RepID=A0ABU7LQE9_9PROT|nr:hypothetical protein [Hyphobacterium sp. HN65]MEE2526128.1 hypothetical protein [Hyphobacterium sp. HN65]